MRVVPSLLCVLFASSLVLAQSGAATADEIRISDERPLLISELAAELRRGASGPQLEAVAKQVAGAIQAVPTQGDASPFVLSPQQKQQLAGLIQAGLQGDPAALEQLNRFPGWNVPSIGQGLRTELGSLAPGQGSAPAVERKVEVLGIPVADQTPPRTTLKHLGLGVYRGDVYDAEKAKRYPDSQRLAELLNRLSMNGTGWVVHEGQHVRSPSGLLDLLRRNGHSVEAYDHRSIANFSGLYYRAPGATTYREVVAPVWLDTQRPVPGKDRTLLVPATHSELVITVRGPQVNADVAFFLGIDNEAKFRPTAWRRPEWTGSKKLRRFKGPDAIRAAAAAGWVRRNMTRLASERRLGELRSNAYGQLGVCNDATALIEGRLGLEATHWPLVRLPEVYQGAGSLTQVSDALPYDTDPKTVPSLKRLIHSLPFVPGQVPDLFPTLAEDVDALVADARAKAAAAKQKADRDGINQAIEEKD